MANIELTYLAINPPFDELGCSLIAEWKVGHCILPIIVKCILTTVIISFVVHVSGLASSLLITSLLWFGWKPFKKKKKKEKKKDKWIKH